MFIESRCMKQKLGFSLLEVLVALVILAIGMLGVAHILLIAHKSNTSNYMKQHAIQTAYNMLDKVRANRQAAINGNYSVNNIVANGAPNVPGAPSTNCNTSICSSSDMASYDTWYWLSNDLVKLPNGCGSVTTAPSGISTLVTVTVQWDDSATTQSLGGTNLNPTQFILQSEL